MHARTSVSPALAGALALTLLMGCQSEPGSIHQTSGNERTSNSADEAEVDPSTHLQAKRREQAVMAEAPAEVTALALPSRAGGAVMQDLADLRLPSEPVDRERYAHIDDNPVKRVTEHPVSTFSIDVDTGSYANVRRFLSQGRLPLRDAVRVEEMINYFRYDYPAPRERTRPFNVVTEIAPTPWNADTYLLHIGIKGYELANEALPPANLVFLVDISGSMRSPDKLPLLKSALKLLSERLRSVDRVSIVVYAGGTGVVLEPTPGDQTARIHAALEALSAGGRTNGAAGIRLAYAMAEQGFVDRGINRVLLATDGDFNVGTVDFEALKDLVEQKRKSGIALTTLGFGTGNYNDHLMEQLADAGNGNHAYIDGLSEANKVLVSQMAGTLATIAKDVKIQIEFNPKVVAEYRLIGYENRALRREDFSNDAVDAGEIGAGHTVTALYEIALVGSGGQRLEPLRYGETSPVPSSSEDAELAFLRLRYKAPGGDRSTLVEQPLLSADIQDDLRSASTNFRFAAAVAGLGQLLKGGQYLGAWGYEEAAALAGGARGEDRHGHRGELVNLVHLARSLASQDVQALRE